MRQKNQAIRNDIYDELLKAYPSWQSSSDIAKKLGIPTHIVRYYLEDMFNAQGYPPRVVRITYSKPRRKEYKAIP